MGNVVVLKPVWAVGRKEFYLLLPEIETLSFACPTCDLAALLTELSRLLILQVSVPKVHNTGFTF
jgi:hypothetical protein